MIFEPVIRRASGFTLLEVLVALAIVGLGLIAIFGQVGQSITVANRIRDKTLADWIAVNRITELRLQGTFPPIGTRSEDVDMANTRWRVTIDVSGTELANLHRADVSVAFADEPDRPIVTVASFLLQQAQPRLPPATGGWEPIDLSNQAAPGQNPPGQNPPGQNPSDQVGQQ